MHFPTKKGGFSKTITVLTVVKEWPEVDVDNQYQLGSLYAYKMAGYLEA